MPSKALGPSAAAPQLPGQYDCLCGPAAAAGDGDGRDGGHAAVHAVGVVGCRRCWRVAGTPASASARHLLLLGVLGLAAVD